jgi:hypothetical protein
MTQCRVRGLVTSLLTTQDTPPLVVYLQGTLQSCITSFSTFINLKLFTRNRSRDDGT